MQRIADLLKRDCCIFIGAGIPNAIGFPSWKKLAEELVEFTWAERHAFVPETITISTKQTLEEHVNEGKSIAAITFCRDCFRGVDRERDFQKKIVNLLHNEEKYGLAKTSPVYMQIVKFFKNAIVMQTNLDKSIEVYCGMPSYVNMILPSATSIPCLVYLHGVITNPSSWIISLDEYINFYQRNPAFLDFIQNVFKKYDVLFLGYSLSDKEILDQIAKVKGAGKQYIAVLEEIEKNRSANYVWENNLRHYGISVIRYSVEQEGYDAFARFLEEINSLMMSPPSVAEQGQDGSKIDG